MNTNMLNEKIPWRKNQRPDFSSKNKYFHDYGNGTPTFIPNIFKDNPAKPTLVSATDPFITAHSAKEYSSLLSLSENGLPKYLEHFKEFTDNVLDINDHVLDDIAKVHIERENKFKEEEEEEEKRLAHQHALELKEKSYMDKEVDKIMKAHWFYVKRCCPVKIPFKSTLTHDEHEFYIKCFIKFQIRRPVNALEEKEYEQYLSMQNRVFDEQSCMINFSFKVSQLVLHEYNNVPAIIDNYIKEHVSHRCQRVFSYPSYYKSEIEIPLKTQNLDLPSADNFQFTHIGHLLSSGNVPWLYLPKPFYKTTLPKDESVFLKRRPDCDDHFDRSHYLYKCPISEDPNAEYLAKLHHASVVITPSAFKVIMNNQEQPYDKEWNIPVRIKSYKVKDDSGKESDTRIIYIDKPLPKKTWLPLQKKYTFLKNSAKALLTGSFNVNRHMNYYRLDDKKPVRNYSSQRFERHLSVEDNIFGGVSEDENVERFGGESSSFTSRSSDKGSKKKNKVKLLGELAKDLFLSEDEDDSTNSLEQDQDQSRSSNRTFVPLSPTKSDENTVTQPYQNSTERTAAPVSNCTSRGGAAIPPPSSYASIKRPLPKEFDSSSHSPSTSVISSETQQPIIYKSKKSKYKEQNSTGLLDTLLDKQDSFLKLKKSPSSSKASDSEVNSVLNPFISSKSSSTKGNVLKPWSGTLKKHKDENFEMKGCPPSCEVNVHYQLFSFANLKQCPVKEECQKQIKVIVRHSVHGLSKQKNQPSNVAKAHVLFPKIESQVFFGAEVNSLSEIIQQWSDLLLRPNTHLLQVRVCDASSDVMMIDEKTLETVLKEGKQQHLNFNPQVAFSTFNVLVNTLMKMSSGHYLLHHSPKTEAFMKLMKASDSKEYVFSSSIDLHKVYSDVSITSKQYRTAPWLAIDTHVLTPFHVTHNKIPGTFPMENLKKLTKHERQKRKTKASNKLSMEGFH